MLTRAESIGVKKYAAIHIKTMSAMSRFVMLIISPFSRSAPWTADLSAEARTGAKPKSFTSVLAQIVSCADLDLPAARRLIRPPFLSAPRAAG
jgi:hypothetical protein